jgi:peptidoglycan/LPS O-acetylase OafA/YrhL
MKLITYFERKAKGKIVQELEGLRFLAITPVILQHFIERWYRNAYTTGVSTVNDTVMNYFLGGGVGVFLFYAISGFILPLPFAAKALAGKPMGNLKVYFMRRLTRLEPPYILVMLLLAISAFVLHKMSNGWILAYFFTGITYSSNLIFHHFNLLNPVIWSLEVEIQFYIVAPFITYFIFKIKDFQKRNFLIVGAILILVFIQQKTGISYGLNFLRYTILGQIHYFLVGILMVNLYLNQKLEPGKDKAFWNVAAPIAFLTMIGFRWVDGYFKTILFVLALSILFIGAFRSGSFNRFMKRPWIMAIGGMCYTIYLLHLALAQGCIELLFKLNPHPHDSVAWFAVYAILFIVSLVLTVPVFYLLIEKPCMDHSWPTRLKAFIKSKTPWALSLEKTSTGNANLKDSSNP